MPTSGSTRSDGDAVRLRSRRSPRSGAKRSLTKVVKRIGEEARRRAQLPRRGDDSRGAEKDGDITGGRPRPPTKIQTVIDKAIEKIDSIADKKQAEIMRFSFWTH